MRKIRVGSRQSALAMTQTNHVIGRLREICLREGWDVEFEIRPIVTKGDRILDVTLSKVGGKGLFVKEIEQSMLNRGIDMAVHSMKDVPSELPEGLMIGAVSPREDPRDALISRDGSKLDELKRGAKIGTSSLRRACQLKRYRPDLEIEWIRGNIDTRLKKLESRDFDAIVLAASGLKRMGWEERITEILPVEVCLPAVGQGALGIECRQGDEEVLRLLERFNDPMTEWAVTAERAFLRKLDGGCQIPIAAYARCETKSPDSGEPSLVLDGLVGSPDGNEVLRDSVTGLNPVQLGEHLADMLISRGAKGILDAVKDAR